MKASLMFIKKKLTGLIPIAIVLGLWTGLHFSVAPLKQAVTPTLFLMVFPMMLTVRFQDIAEAVKTPRPVFISLALNFILAPIVAFFLSRLFLSEDPMLILGMVLVGLLPTSGMTASWTGLSGGRVQTALVMMSVNLLFAILALPVWIKILVPSGVTLHMGGIVVSLIKIVVLPLVVAQIVRILWIRKKGEKAFLKTKPVLGGVSALGVLLIVFLATSLKAKTIWNNPLLTLKIFPPLILFYSILITAGHFTAKALQNRGDRPALVYGTALRNLTIALGMSLSAFGESTAVLLIAIAYMVQLPFAAGYMKWLESRIQKKHSENT